MCRKQIRLLNYIHHTKMSKAFFFSEHWAWCPEILCYYAENIQHICICTEQANIVHRLAIIWEIIVILMAKDVPAKKDWINIHSTMLLHTMCNFCMWLLWTTITDSAVRFAGSLVENGCKAKAIMQDQKGFGSALRLDLHFSAVVLIGS